MKPVDGMCLFAGYLNYDITVRLNSNFDVGKRINSVIHTSVGGMAANAASIAASLGSNSVLFSSIGDDEVGKHLKFRLEKYKVVTSCLDFRKGLRSPHCIIQVESDGQRTIISEKIEFDYSNIINFLSERPNDIKIIYLDGYRFFDCDPILEISRENRIPVVIDLDGYEDHSIDSEKLSYFDSIILNKSLLRQLTGGNSLEKNKDYFSRLFSSKVICTCAEDGVELLQNKNFVKIPATQMKVVDTTGAGDTFAGAYVHGIANGLPTVENIKYSSKIASKSIAYGGSLGLLEAKH